MLIGIDASRANKKFKTGVEWYSHCLIEEFKKIDRENQYFLYTDRPLVGELAVCPANFHQKILKWPLPKFWTLGRLTLEMLMGQRPDVLFVPAHTLPLINPRKSVVTIHDIGFERFPEFYKWPDIAYHRFAIKTIKRCATKIITVSEFSKREIMDVYKIPAEKIVVTHIGFVAPVADRVDLVRDEIKKISKQPFVLFVGRLEAKKNVARMIEAFGRVREKNPTIGLKFVLAGRPGFGYEKILETMEKNNLNNDVVLLDWISKEELGFLYRRASALLFATLYEGFGIPPLEAMSVGCPVVCSNTTSLPEIVGNAALLVNPLDIENIADGLSQILFNDEKRKRYIEAGKLRATTFTWESCARETLNVLLSN
ncbi:MAG: glycosyltransferase family 1 protein [Candidatus Falkowbacteria bacterium]